MKKYIEHLQNNRTSHERRQISMRIAGVITALLFIVWLSTLGMRVTGTRLQTDIQNAAATLYAVDGSQTTGQ